MLAQPAARAYLGACDDEELHLGIRADDRADIAAVQHGALRPAGELALLLNEDAADLRDDGDAGRRIGDRMGRLTTLFGSILLYSLANIANGFVNSFEAYATWRFIAGIGLAGELGGCIALVSESLSKERRGYGTALVATVRKRRRPVSTCCSLITVILKRGNRALNLKPRNST